MEKTYESAYHRALDNYLNNTGYKGDRPPTNDSKRQTNMSVSRAELMARIQGLENNQLAIEALLKEFFDSQESSPQRLEAQAGLYAWLLRNSPPWHYKFIPEWYLNPITNRYQKTPPKLEDEKTE